MDESVNRANTNYNFFRELLKKREVAGNSAESEITTLSSQLSYSRTLAGELEEKVRRLKVTFNEKQMRLTELDRQLDISQRTYAILAAKVEDARIAKAMELGEVKMVSTAFEPKSPIGPNKKKNVAIVGAMSLMLGIFVAFFLEILQKTKEIHKIGLRFQKTNSLV